MKPVRLHSNLESSLRHEENERVCSIIAIIIYNYACGLSSRLNVIIIDFKPVPLWSFQQGPCNSQSHPNVIFYMFYQHVAFHHVEVTILQKEFSMQYLSNFLSSHFSAVFVGGILKLSVIYRNTCSY